MNSNAINNSAIRLNFRPSSHDHTRTQVSDPVDRFTPSLIEGLPDPIKYPEWGARPRPVCDMPNPFECPEYWEKSKTEWKSLMPDFSRKLDIDPWLKTDDTKSEWKYVPDYNKYPKDPPGICGGWDAPMFHNGKVMTRREYFQREAAGQL